MENKYRLLKNFTPRDLYEEHAPIELFLKCMERRCNDINLTFYFEGNFKVGIEIVSIYLKPYEPWIPWLIENKFIEEIEEEIELKPGMILEQMVSGYQYIMTNNGLYYSKGFIEKVIGRPSEDHKDCKTLQELNNISGCRWKVLY